MDILLKIIKAAALLLSVIFVLLLGRSYYQNDELYISSPYLMVYINSNHGGLHCYCEWERPYYTGMPWDVDYERKSVKGWNNAALYIDRGIGGFGVGAAYWIIILLIWIIPAVNVLKRLTSKPAPGVCPKCSYDIRATTDECPECGYKTQH